MAMIKTSLPAVKSYLPYEDFLVQFDGIHAEWVNGRVERRAPTTDRHDQMSRFLDHLLSAFIDAHRLGCIKTRPAQTLFGPDLLGREPDLMFIAHERLDIIKRHFVDGPPDLAIEVVSPESHDRDYGVKTREYEKAGVREYWIIDPERQDALFYHRASDGVFRRIAPDADGCYHSQVLPGLALDVALLWREPLPDYWEAGELVLGMAVE